MLMKLISLLGLVLILGACSSRGTNGSADIPLDDVEREYILRDRNPNPAPDWVRDFRKFRNKAKDDGYFYYIGESGETSDRIGGCELANAEANKKVSMEIATMISSKLANTRSGQLVIDRYNKENPGMRRHFESSLAQKSMAFLRGAREEDSYWEERDYSKVGGNKRVYVCQSLVKIAAQDLKAALNKTANKAPQVVEDQEAKATVKQALKGIDKYFDSYKAE